MKIYDISQEVLESEIYPGDPAPRRIVLKSTQDGELYNLSDLYMGMHNGTHVDAPFHFLPDGKTVEQIDTERFVGTACVVQAEGLLNEEAARNILKTANGIKRILIKGDAVVSPEAAGVFAEAKLYLLGNESQSVGPMDAPMAVHLELLGAEVVLLEGIRLSHVEAGEYILCAAPLNIKGSEGAPCRAVLIKL